MTAITKFWIMCINCREQSLCNLQWHPKETIIMTCVRCGEAEAVKAVGEAPLTVDQYKRAIGKNRIEWRNKN